MSRKWMIIIMASAVLLRELHRFLSTDLRSGFFPLDREYQFSPAWYYTFIVWKGFDAITHWFFAYRESKRDRFFARMVGVMALFYTMDLLLFLLINSQAGIFYGIGILTVLVYATYTLKKS